MCGLSSCWRRWEGFGCSPIKKLRELGSNRDPIHGRRLSAAMQIEKPTHISGVLTVIINIE